MSKFINSVYYCGAWGTGLDKIPDDVIDSIDILWFSNADVKPDKLIYNNETDPYLVKQLKERAPNLKVVLGVVGLQALPQNMQSMQDAAYRIAKSVNEYGFDGVDVDWEFPTKENAHIHTAFMRFLRAMLGPHKIVSFTTPTTQWAFDIMNIRECSQFCDYINVMSYDCYSERPITCDHTAPLPDENAPYPCASLQENIELFISRGINPEKIISGAAFYSRVWHGVHGGDGYKVEVGAGSDYGPKYNEITPEYIENGGYTFSRGANLAPRLYNGEDFITYDDEMSIVAKCELCRQYGTAGMMAWEYACDTDDHKLLKIMRYALDRE